MTTTHIYRSNDFYRQVYVDCDDPIIEELTAFRLALLDNGYEPIPVRGKGGKHDDRNIRWTSPAINPGWTTGAITTERVRSETAGGTAKLNTGFRCGRVAVPDNDVKDPEHAAAVDELIEHFLGISPLKRRGSKGAAYCYYNKTPIKKLTVTDANDTRLFEILGDGQQFVGYGKHPEGMDYQWIGDGEPATVPLDELPEVTPEQLYTLHAAIRELLIGLGYEFKISEEPRSEKPKSTTTSTSLSHNEDEDAPALCRAALAVIPNDCDREEWIKVCYAIRDAGLDYDDWQQWCDKWHKPHKPGSVKTAWESCGTPRSVTFRTLLEKADKADPEWRSRYYAPINKAKSDAYWEAEMRRVRADFSDDHEPEFDDYADDDPWFDDGSEEQQESPKQEPPKRKTRFRSRAESRDLPPPVYLVQDLIEDGADAVIYGNSESLKTFFALAMGGSLATGIPAFGKFEIPNKGVVFYFAAEGQRNMETRRLTAWEVDNGLEPFSVENVWIGDGAFVIDDKDVAECILDIECHLGDQKGKVPVLFVIDTLSRALNGQDEDKANVAAKYLNNVKKIKDRIGGTSLTIAHTGKDRARGLRGSSGYFAGFDTVLAVDTNQDPDTLLHTSELTVEKQKDGITGIHYWFQSREVEIPTGKSLVLDPISDEDGKKDMTKRKSMNVNDVHSAIKSLAPNGSPLTKRQVATKVAAMMGITIDGAEKALDRHKDKDNDLYKVYRDGDKFRFPSSMQGADQTIADQIKELRDDETRRIRQSIQEQMDGIFPNGKSAN